MISVRAVDQPHEIETFHQRALEVYQPNADIEVALPRRLAELAAMPDLPPGGQRAAFVDGEIVGGYTMFERDLCVGPSRLRTGCIGAVYTCYAYRKQGVASALMRDAIYYAVNNDYALLLLDGIPNFYDKFGYVDMHDVTRFSMKSADLLSLKPGAWQTRLATEDDAALLLELYQRHLGDFVGSFERSQEIQRFKVRTAAPTRLFILALDPQGEPGGYIVLRTNDRRRSAEVVAESWGAAQMLLTYHADFAKDDEKSPGDIEVEIHDQIEDRIDWLVPPTSQLAMMLTDQLSVKRITECVHTGGWMARVGNVDALLNSLLPVWNERLAACGCGWNGSIDLYVDDRRWQLWFDDSSVRIIAGDASATPFDASAAAQSVRLTQEQLVRICFGYPSLEYAARDAMGGLAPSAKQAFLAMFAGKPVWITGTDFF